MYFTVLDDKIITKFRFNRSPRHLGFSLDTLALSLQKEHFINLRSECTNLNETQLKILMQKGVFFYDFFWKVVNGVLPLSVYHLFVSLSPRLQFRWCSPSSLLCKQPASFSYSPLRLGSRR